MNITFLIGNGFDLACGLPTSYADVYEEYIKQPSESLVVKKFKEDLIANKTKEKWGNWADFEMGMADYAKNFETEKEFIECVSDFKDFLIRYLRKVEIGFLRKFRVEQDSYKDFSFFLNNDIIKFYSGLSKNLDNELKPHPLLPDERIFVNFNYTSIFERVLKHSQFEKAKVLHIHGKLGEDGIVLGVNDIEQIKTKFLLTKKGKRVFIKPFFNQDFDKQKIQETFQTIMHSNCICVFGLSLGDSDLMWKTCLVDWLKQKTDHHIFIYDYNCSMIGIEDAALKMNEEDDQKEIILKRLGIFTEDCPFLDQVHIPIGKQLFSIFGAVKAILEKNSVAKSA